MKSRLEQGYTLLNKLHGEHSGKELVDAVGDICPDYADLTAEFAFGHIFSRPQLSIKVRELIVISLCAALGDMENQLHAHIEAAIQCGATEEECVESILQVSLYAGFPRVTNALLLSKTVFQK